MALNLSGLISGAKSLVSSIGNEFSSLAQLPSTLAKAKQSADIAQSVKLKLDGLIKPNISGNVPIVQSTPAIIAPAPDIKNPLSTTKAPNIISQTYPLNLLYGLGAGLTDAIARAGVGTLKEFQKVGQEYGLKPAPLTEGILSFAEKNKQAIGLDEIKTYGDAMTQEYDKQNQINPPTKPIEAVRNSLTAVANTLLPRMFDIFAAEGVFESLARQGLKATYSMEYKQALQRFGLADNFTKEEFKNAFVNSAQSVAQTGDRTMFNNVLNSARTIVEENAVGQTQLNAFGKAIQSISETLTKPIGDIGKFAQPFAVPIAGELSGYRPVNPEVKPVGLGTQAIEPVGFGGEKPKVPEVPKVEWKPTKIKFEDKKTANLFYQTALEADKKPSMFGPTKEEPFYKVIIYEKIKPEISAIPPSLQPLAEEAKKWTPQQKGMAEDAIKQAKAQGAPINPDGTITLYHGTDVARAPKEGDTLRVGTYFTTDEATAKQFANQGEGKNPVVMKVQVPAQKVFAGKGDGYWTLNEKTPLVTENPLATQATKGVKVPPASEVGQPTPIPEVSKVESVALNTSFPKDVSLTEIIPQENVIANQIKTDVVKNDVTGTVQDNIQPIEQEPELITTRKFKQTDEWQKFAKYAEDNIQGKDIHPAILFRHVSMTAERVAEFLDGGINGEVYKKIVKPVYDSAEKVNREAEVIKKEFDNFKILEGSSSDKNASLFAQGKLNTAKPNEMAAAKYVRTKYDEFLTRLNTIRAKLGVEPIPKRADYVTHINELNVLSELFGGLERVSTQGLISKLKNELLDQHADWTDARAFDAAKRQVEGTTGIGQYVDARQPSFRFAKERLTDFEKDPSIVRSFGAYTPPALRYIHQAENVARNKAFKDVLPANAKEFIRLWNTEQVAGRVPPSFLSPQAKRLLSIIKGTLGSNTILGNLATTMMQLTSFPQVFAIAGVKNTFFGIGKRLVTYLTPSHSFWNVSRSKALRNLDIDIGLGDSIIDKLLVSVGKLNVLRDPAARTRQAIDFGRDVLMSIMEMADQFTVGASYEAFYRKAVLDGLFPDAAKEYADIMTGKTQANYFKEALPPFLNTTEGKTIGQFGTYTMNQWEMIRKDLGKKFLDGGKSQKNLRSMFKQFLVFLVSAYLIDALSEKTFGRQPYDVKSLTDETVKLVEGKSDFGKEAGALKNTVASYVPFMGSVKYKSMPPVFDFGGDVINATLGSGAAQQTAINNLSEKWIYNILLPYGGGQARKTLQGIQAVSGVNLPFVKNTSKNIKISDNIDKAKAIIFGVSATQASIDYYDKPALIKSTQSNYGSGKKGMQSSYK